MSSLFEQLGNGEVSEQEIKDKLSRLRSDMNTRIIALQSMNEEQARDKKEASYLQQALNNYHQSRKKTKRSQYIRVSVHSLDEVFAIMGQGKIVTPEGHTINTDSLRYELFKEKGVICVECGLRGLYFAKEKDSKEKEEVYHFNLYGIREGEEILFTKDHIRPRSKGGKDELDNLQTMCMPCNCRKGNKWEDS